MADPSYGIDTKPHGDQTTAQEKYPGEIMNNKLTKSEKEGLERNKQTLMIIWKGSKPPKADELFWSWCRRTNNPYVHIRKRRMQANIMMDLPNASGLLDAEGSNQFRALCLSYGLRKTGRTFTKPSMDDVPLELTEDFAQKLVAIGLDYCRRHSPV